jgi:hypothetical protein
MRVRASLTDHNNVGSVDIDVDDIKSPEQIERVIHILRKLREALWPKEENADGD